MLRFGFSRYSCVPPWQARNTSSLLSSLSRKTEERCVFIRRKVCTLICSRIWSRFVSEMIICAMSTRLVSCRPFTRNWSISQASSSHCAASKAISTRRASSVSLKASICRESTLSSPTTCPRISTGTAISDRTRALIAKYRLSFRTSPGAERLARRGDPAGDALAGPQLNPLGPFAQAVARLDVEEARVGIDENERAAIGPRRTDRRRQDAVDRLLRMKQRAQVAPAQFGKQRGPRTLHATMRSRISRVRSFKAFSEVIFFPPASQR